MDPNRGRSGDPNRGRSRDPNRGLDMGQNADPNGGLDMNRNGGKQVSHGADVDTSPALLKPNCCAIGALALFWWVIRNRLIARPALSQYTL
jgi:hypothetical protein